jgi:hypothetical protein
MSLWPDMSNEKLERGLIEIGPNAHVSIARDSEWVILYVDDGGGGKSTVSLSVLQALDLASLIKGSAITAAGVKK